MSDRSYRMYWTRDASPAPTLADASLGLNANNDRLYLCKTGVAVTGALIHRLPIGGCCWRTEMTSRRSILGLLGGSLSTFAGCAGLPSGSPTTGSPGTDPSTSSRQTTSTSDSERTSTADSPPTEPETPSGENNDCEHRVDPNPLWSFEREVLRRPLFATDHLLVAAQEAVYSLDPTDGSVQWERSIDGTLRLLSDGAVILDTHAELMALEVPSGHTRWSIERPAEHAVWSNSAAVHDGGLYVGASQLNTPQTDYENEFGRIYRIGLKSGKLTRIRDLRYDNGDPIEPDYLLADETGVYVTIDEGILALTLDGSTRWRRIGDQYFFSPVRSGRSVIQPWSRGVYAFDIETGGVRWQHPGPDMHVAVADGMVFGAGGGGPDSSGRLWAIDVANGQEQWQTPIDGCGGHLIVDAGVVTQSVGCRETKHLRLTDAASGCHYGDIPQETTGVPRFDIGGGRLYASLQGEEGDRLVAVELP